MSVALALPRVPRLRAVAVAALALLNVADLVTTRLLVTVREANPVAAWLLAHGSYLTLGLVKAFAVGAVAALALAAPRDRRWVTASVCFVAALYAIAVAGNATALALT